MRNLIKFISLYNYSITFYLLVFFSSYFLVNDNFVLKTKYLNSSNYIIGTVFSFQTSITDYFRLEEKNKLYSYLSELIIRKVLFTKVEKVFHINDIKEAIDVASDFNRDGKILVTTSKA